MKNLLFIGMIFVAFTAFGQEEANENIQEKGSQEPEIGCIIWPEEIAIRQLAFNVDDYFRSQIVQPYSLITRFPCGNISKEARERYFEKKSKRVGPLNQDLPFMHTLTGSVYTFDYFRNSVR